MKKLVSALIGAVMMAAASGASAEVLAPDVWTPLPGTTVAVQPELAGLVLEDETQAFSFSADGGTITGTVQSRVVRSDVDGTLDFYWRIISDPRSTVPLSAFRLGNFFTPVYDANWRIDGEGDTAPTEAKWFGGGGGKVNFVFGTPNGGGLAPGDSSYFLLLDTNAIAYARTGVYDLTGLEGISGLFETFAPSQIPEPASAAIFTLGFVGLMWGRRRKGPAA